MNEVGFLFQIVLVLAATVTPVIVAVRLIAGPDASAFGGMLQTPTRPSWPLGVQEEEPTPWMFGPASA